MTFQNPADFFDPNGKLYSDVLEIPQPCHELDTIVAIANGEIVIVIVIVVDDKGRENEGDIIIAADAVTPATINFMATLGRGLICVAMTADWLEHLALPQMVPENTKCLSTGFTIACDLKQDTTTGISASDRAETLLTLVDDRRRAATSTILAMSSLFGRIRKAFSVAGAHRGRSGPGAFRRALPCGSSVRDRAAGRRDGPPAESAALRPAARSQAGQHR